MSEPDDETLELNAAVARMKEEAAAAQTRMAIKIAELEALGEKVDRAQAAVFARRTPDAVEPETPQTRLAKADANFTALVADPTSTQAQRERALILRQRAEREFENEQTRVANLGRMMRSMDLREQDRAKRDDAERAAAAAKEASEKAQDEIRWGHARRQKYIGG